MSPIGTAVEADLGNPAMDDPRVLPGRQMGRPAKTAWEQVGIPRQIGAVEPGSHGVTGLIGDLEAHGLGQSCPGQLLHLPRWRWRMAMAPWLTSRTRRATRSQALSFESMARLNSASSRDLLPKLKAYPNGPDVAELQRGLAAYKLALVPRHCIGTRALHLGLLGGEFDDAPARLGALVAALDPTRTLALRTSTKCQRRSGCLTTGS